MTEHTVLQHMASRVSFRRTKDAPVEYGLAVFTEPAAIYCVAIIPDSATTPADVLRDVYMYHLRAFEGCVCWPVGVE